MYPFDKFYQVDFTVLAIAKRWIGVKSYSDLIEKVIESYKDEYCDLSGWRHEEIAKIVVERWVNYNEQLNLFHTIDLITFMSPEKSWMVKFGSEDLDFYGSCLRSIVGILALIESSKLPGFHQWLVDTGKIKEIG